PGSRGIPVSVECLPSAAMAPWNKIGTQPSDCNPSPLPAGLVQPFEHMRVILRPHPRHTVASPKFELAGGEQFSLCQGFLRLLLPPQLTERRGEPSIRNREIGEYIDGSLRGFRAVLVVSEVIKTDSLLGERHRQTRSARVEPDAGFNRSKTVRRVAGVNQHGATSPMRIWQVRTDRQGSIDFVHRSPVIGARHQHYSKTGTCLSVGAVESNRSARQGFS